MIRNEPNVLILTNPEDFHSFVVAEALRRKGVPVSLWHSTDFPRQQTGSLWLSEGSTQWEAIGSDLAIGRAAPSSVWLRRPGLPVLPEDISPADRDFALAECKSFLNGLYHAAGTEAFWVNPPTSFTRARLKTEQIRSASKAGLKVPRTLFSNDPRRIRDFVRSASGGAIYKSFYPASWQRDDGVAVLFSSAVGEADLPEDSVLQATPGIFQEIVPKAYEIRITAIGRRLFAAKLDSQGIPSARLDFRAATTPVPVELAKIPIPVQAACQKIMDDLGIVFGCFDLIATPEGDYVFLEVNETGAFVWIEEQNPEIKLVDAFSELLIQGTPRFQKRRSSPVNLGDVSAAALHEMQTVAPKKHVRRIPEFVHNDHS